MADGGGAISVVAADARRVMRAFGETVHVHLGGRETGGKATVFTNITPVGGGPPPHRHEREDEWFYVLEGQASFLVDGRWSDPLGPGASVFVPRGTVHGFKNVGPGELRQLITTSPSGFELFFAKAAEEFARPQGPRMDVALQIAAEFGIIFEPQ